MKTIDHQGSQKRTVGMMSVDAQVLAEALQRVKPGEAISYQELSDAIGRDIRNGAHYVLSSARKYLEREERIVFDVVQAQGLVRLNDEQIALTSMRSIRHVHRTVRRGRQRLLAADYNSLSKQAQTVHNTNLSVMGVMEHVTKPSQVKKLSAKVESGGKALAFQKTLEAFQE